MDHPPLIDTGPSQLKHQWLDNCQLSYKYGQPVALYIAMQICKEHGIPIPDWLRDAMIDVLEKAFDKGALNTGAGRHANPLVRFQDDIAHFLRWETACALKGKAVESAHLYAEAAEAMKDSVFAAKEDQIKKSYELVEAALSDPKQAGRFLFLTHPEMQKLGLWILEK